MRNPPNNQYTHHISLNTHILNGPHHIVLDFFLERHDSLDVCCVCGVGVCGVCVWGCVCVGVCVCV